MKTAVKSENMPYQPSFTAEDYNVAYRVCLRYLRDPDLAQDAAQDAMLTAYRKQHKFRGDSRWRTWLYRVAQTSSLMLLRKRKRISREILMGEHQSWYENMPTGDMQSRIVARESLEVVRKALDTLPEKQRSAFTMRYVAGYTDTECSEALKVPKSTVKTRAHRARRAIRAAIAQPILETE